MSSKERSKEGATGRTTERGTERIAERTRDAAAEPRTDVVRTSLSPRALAMAAVEAALDKKGLEPVLLDLSEQGSYTDFLLVVSGRSDRHVQHVAEGILETFAQDLGRRPLGSEGKGDGRWVLIDFGDIVVHVFHHPLREFYDLEGLWCDAPRVALDIPDEARVAAPHQHHDYY